MGKHLPSDDSVGRMQFLLMLRRRGITDAAVLRALDEALPIVMLTAKAELVDIRNGLALGADGYITKPYSKNQLAEVIGRVLKH